MILSALAALSLIRNLENLNEIAPPVVQAGPVGKEIGAVKELQSRVADIMWNEHAKGASTMLRWLRAKKMDVNGAEKMIRDHIEWRKKYNIDKLRHTAPDPKLYKSLWYNMTGFARNQNPVMLLPFGSWDIRGYMDAGGNREEFDRHQGQMWEKALAAVEGVELKMKGPRKDNSPVTYIMLCDMGGLQYRQLANFNSLQFVLSMVFNFENNYPEVIYYAYLINSDWVVDTLVRIIRPFMTGSIDKLKVYGDRSKWEKVIRKQIDPAIIPYRYGGYTEKERQKMKLPPLPSCKFC